MATNPNLSLSPSHLTILRIVSALAWADGNLTPEESDIVINQFRSDLPPNPNPFLYLGEIGFFPEFNADYSPVHNELSTYVDAELALRNVIEEYAYNPISIDELVNELNTPEDKALALKLGYMVIKASANHHGELISPEEKSVYRRLIGLLGLDNNLVKEIELQASNDLDKFQRPFQHFVSSLKSSLGL